MDLPLELACRQAAVSELKHVVAWNGVLEQFVNAASEAGAAVIDQGHFAGETPDLVQPLCRPEHRGSAGARPVRSVRGLGVRPPGRGREWPRRREARAGRSGEHGQSRGASASRASRPPPPSRSRRPARRPTARRWPSRMHAGETSRAVARRRQGFRGPRYADRKSGRRTERRRLDGVARAGWRPHRGRRPESTQSSVSRYLRGSGEELSCRRRSGRAVRESRPPRHRARRRRGRARRETRVSRRTRLFPAARQAGWQPRILELSAS